jgi:hypothetical protein
MLVGVVIHVDEVTQNNFFVALRSRQNPGQELIRGIGGR